VARLIEGLVPTYGGMLVAQVTWGFGYTFISGALTAWITDEVGEEHVEAILLEGTQISAIAEGVGIVLAVLLSMVSLKWPILLSGVLFIVLAGLMVMFMPETNFQKSSESPIGFGLGLATFKQSFGLIRASRFLLVFALVIFLIGLSSEGFDRLYTPLMLSHLDLNTVEGMREEIWFGILRGGALLMSLGLTQLVKNWRKLENSPKLGMILGGMMIVQIIGVLVVANTHVLWVFFLSFWLVNGLRETTYPLQSSWVIQFIPAKLRATVLSMTEQMDAFGQTIGGMPIGYIGQRFSIGLAISMTTVFLVPVVGLYAWLTGMAAEKVEVNELIV
jgi:DHA3 family tetracycline resistance protein-like MFS transporter